MKVRSLVMENYRRHRDVTIEFPDGVFAVVGENGSGKSSILEAIGFALFGVQATRTSKAQLRHAGAAPSDPVRVSLELELAGQAVHVVREFRGANLTAHAGLTIDGKATVTQGANSHAAVTSEVERLLGMDRTAFFTSIVAQQKELSRLADLTAADRKQLILKMLGIESLDKAIEEARTRRRAAESQLSGLRESMPDPDTAAKALVDAKQAHEEATRREAAGRKEWESARESLAKAQAGHDAAAAADKAHQLASNRLESSDAKCKDLARRVDDLTSRQRAAEQAAARAEQLSGAPARRAAAAKALSEARRLQDQRAQAERARQESKKVQQQLDALRSTKDPGHGKPLHEAEAAARRALAQAREDQAARRARQAQISEHLAGVSGHEDHVACPLCEQPLEGGVGALRARLEQEAARLAKEIQAAEATIRDLDSAAAAATVAVTRWQDARRAYETAQARKTELEARLASLQPATSAPELGPDMDALETEAKAAEEEDVKRIRAQAQAEALPGLATELVAAKQAIAAAESDRAAAKQALEAAPKVGLAPARQALEESQVAEREGERIVLQAASDVRLASKAIEAAQARLEALERHRGLVKRAETSLRTWTALAGGRNTGLLEQFRSHLVGKIRPAINAEASRLLGRFTDGRYQELILDEDYGIFLVDEGVPHALARFSGGESDLAHLALRLAVSRLLTHRSGAADLRFLALDEVFGSLDRRRRDAVLGALHGLEELYSQVVLVTHQEDLREGLDAVLEVRTDGDASVVRFHHG